MKKTSVLLILLVFIGSSPSFAQDKVRQETMGDSGTNGAASGISNSAFKLKMTYEDLRLIWDDCYQLGNIGQDLANEGKNAPPRNKWLSYFVESAGQILPKMKIQAENLEFPADSPPALNQQKADIQSAIMQMQAAYGELQTAVGQVTSAANDKYPPIYWKPAHAITENAGKLNTLLLSIYSALDSGRNISGEPEDAMANASAVAGTEKVVNSGKVLTGSATAVQAEQSIKSIGDTGNRISKAAFGLIGELERWNLLYGKPPKNGPADMLYGGGFTEQEVLTQYRYLPTTVFTMPAYVKLYSYRLPPRQNMLAYYTAQIGSGLNLMEAELNEATFPKAEEDSLSGPWEELKRTFMDSRSQYLSLLQMVNASNDDRLQKSIREDELAFGSPVSTIYSNMSKLQSLLADMKALLK